MQEGPGPVSRLFCLRNGESQSGNLPNRWPSAASILRPTKMYCVSCETILKTALALPTARTEAPIAKVAPTGWPCLPSGTTLSPMSCNSPRRRARWLRIWTPSSTGCTPITSPSSALPAASGCQARAARSVRTVRRFSGRPACGTASNEVCTFRSSRFRETHAHRLWIPAQRHARFRSRAFGYAGARRC